MHKFEAKYLNKVEEAYTAAVKLYVKYRKALNISAKKSKLKLLEVKFKNLISKKMKQRRRLRIMLGMSLRMQKVEFPLTSVVNSV